MDLSTSLSGAKGFRIVKRGYDPDEVDGFLEQIASGVGELKRKLAEAEDRASAAGPAGGGDAAAAAEAEEIKRALVLAQRAADEEVRKATEEGEALIAEARQRSEELRRETDEELARMREEGKADLLAEIAELEATRDSLADDVVLLERHVDEQREVVQAAIGELQALLDHPEAFRIAAPSGISTSSPVDRPLAPVRPPAETTEEPAEWAGPAASPDPEAVAAAVEEVTAADDGPVDADDVGSPDPGGSSADEAPDPGWATPPATDSGPPNLFEGPPGGDEDESESGPPTEAHDTLAADGEEESEDAFLAELRKAMLDEEPLGPRDAVTDTAEVEDDFGPRTRTRFGRRR